MSERRQAGTEPGSRAEPSRAGPPRAGPSRGRLPESRAGLGRERGWSREERLPWAERGAAEPQP